MIPPERMDKLGKSLANAVSLIVEKIAGGARCFRCRSAEPTRLLFALNIERTERGIRLLGAMDGCGACAACAKTLKMDSDSAFADGDVVIT